MITKEEYIEWLTKSYTGNLKSGNKDIVDLVKKSFELGASIKIDTNLGELQKEYVELFQAMALGFIDGVKLGTSFDHCDNADLENMMKNNPGGIEMK